MSLLEEAEQLINNERAAEYGEPNILLEIVAHYWEPILKTTKDGKISPLQVVQCMIALKLARTVVNPDHRDSFVDIAGYAGLSERVLKRGGGNGGGSSVSNN